MRSGPRQRRPSTSDRPPTGQVGSAAIRTTTTGSTGRPRPDGPSCALQSREVADALSLEEDGPTRRKFLARLQGEISKRGGHRSAASGCEGRPHQVDFFYGTPSPGNAVAGRYTHDRFSVTRQLRYSRDETQLALDLGLFINGLPVATFELKNSLTNRRSPMPSSSTGGIATHARSSSSSGVAWSTSPGRARSSLLHPPKGQGIPVPALQPRLERRRRQSAQPERPQDRLPLEAGPHSRGADGHPRELAQVVETKDEKTGKKKAIQVWRGITSWTWCAGCWPTQVSMARVDAISSSTRRVAASRTPSPGLLIS